MENHPIPQDVTGFKFKLIGSVTVKQFLYLLAAGGICGLLFIMPIIFIIKWPLIMLFAGIGAALAFLPIEGRPLDVMLLNFIKAIPAENRFIFHKRGATALLHDYFDEHAAKKAVEKKPDENTQDKRRELLMSQLVRKTAPYAPDPEERAALNTIRGAFTDSATPVTGMTSVESLETPQPARQSAIVRPPVDMPQPEPTPPPTPPAAAEPATPQEPEPTSLPLAQPAPPPVEETPLPPTQVTTPEAQVQAGFPQIPDVPNVLLGIVKDARGKVLPNIIVEVIDVNQTPARTFKTNALGQFSAATPLGNGTYQLLLEDTRGIHEFAPITIELTGEIFQPLEIISVDQREKLRQELFGGPPATA